MDILVQAELVATQAELRADLDAWRAWVAARREPLSRLEAELLAAFARWVTAAVAGLQQRGED